MRSATVKIPEIYFHNITLDVKENMTEEEKSEIMEQMSAEQADAAMRMAETEFAGVDEDENSEETPNG